MRNPKLKTILGICDPYEYVEIEDAEDGECLIGDYLDDHEDELIEANELLDRMLDREDDLLDKQVVRIYHNFGKIYIEIKY